MYMTDRQYVAKSQMSSCKWLYSLNDRRLFNEPQCPQRKHTMIYKKLILIIKKKNITIITWSSLLLGKLLYVWSFASYKFLKLFKKRKIANFTISAECECMWLHSYDLCRGEELVENWMELSRHSYGVCDYNVILIEDSDCTIFSVDLSRRNFIFEDSEERLNENVWHSISRPAARGKLVNLRSYELVNVVKFEWKLDVVQSKFEEQSWRCQRTYRISKGTALINKILKKITTIWRSSK